MGLYPTALIVLVDRQQGWKEKFEKEEIGVPVWAGMTLHDVRRELIAMGEMKRCDTEVERRNPVIVALDGQPWDSVLAVAERLRTTGSILKVNDLLFAQGMDHLLPELATYGRVMVDLKGHDIPATVANTCRRLARHHVWAVTVHASGGHEMIGAARNELQSTSTKVLAVTALTSLDDEACKRIYGTDSDGAVRKLAAIAYQAGAHGLVCSPHEVGEVKAGWPDENKIYVTPGVRSVGLSANDQARISTPKYAMDNGANYLVMGRQILGALDPAEEVRRVLREELLIVL